MFVYVDAGQTTDSELHAWAAPVLKHWTQDGDGQGAPAPPPPHRATKADPGPWLAPACPRTPRAPSRRHPQRHERLLAPARPWHRPANAGTPAELSGSPASRSVKPRSVDSGLNTLTHLETNESYSVCATVRQRGVWGQVQGATSPPTPRRTRARYKMGGPLRSPVQ